jgi:uncharacterized protein involved in exopolysaccharide biosynthesis
MASTRIRNSPPRPGLRKSFDALAERLGITQSVVQKDPAVVALQNLATAVVARRQERTYVVDLSVTTREPEKSALIANAIIKAYLAELDAARTDAVRRATDALSSRLQELRDRLRDAEDRSERYKADNNIVAASGQLINEQQLTDLSNQLTLANVRAEEAKARLDQIERLRRNRVDPVGISEAVQAPTLAALRAQYAEVQHREAELAAQLGARHPSIVDIKAQARDLRLVIDREVGRLSEAARGDYDRAGATQDTLERRLVTLKGEAVSTSQALVRLRALEREVEASRAVYQAFLARSRETSGQERFGTVNVRVLSETNQRAKKAWPPPAIIVLAAAFAFGAAAGAGLGVVRDWSDDRIRSRRNLEAVCQLPLLAEIPGISEDRNMKGRWTRMLAKARAHRQGVALMATLLDAPKSRFADGIHRLAYALRSAGPNGAPRVMTFIAAGEPGARSEVALSLAARFRVEPETRTAGRCRPYPARAVEPRGRQQRRRPARGGGAARRSRRRVDRRATYRSDGAAGRPSAGERRPAGRPGPGGQDPRSGTRHLLGDRRRPERPLRSARTRARCRLRRHRPGCDRGPDTRARPRRFSAQRRSRRRQAARCRVRVAARRKRMTGRAEACG